MYSEPRGWVADPCARKGQRLRPIGCTEDLNWPPFKGER
jgi:hypothetical protein